MSSEIKMIQEFHVKMYEDRGVMCAITEAIDHITGTTCGKKFPIVKFTGD